MYIEAVPNRNSPPAILLRESYRVGGKIKKRTLLNLSDWPCTMVEGLRALLKGGTVLPPGQGAITIKRSLPHGHVAAALGTLRRIGFDRLLGPAGNRCRDLVIAMMVARVISPVSKLATANGQVAQQVTYSGHLLYSYSGDAAPGDVKGVGIPGWYPVSPSGAKVDKDEGKSSGAGSGGGY